jgi:hypothetical protein
VRPIAGGPDDPAANDTLDDATATFYAQQILAGSPMPAMGMGKTAAQNRQKVMNTVAKLAGAEGRTGEDLARQIAHYQAGKKKISTLETQLGTVSQAEQTALANGQQFIDRSNELPGQTEYPLLNSVTQTAQRYLPVPGHQTVSAMDAAFNTFASEYAKVVAGSPSGAGTLSDSARHEAQETIRSNASPSQKMAAFKQMQADMANRIAASHRVISDAYDTLTKQPEKVPDSLSAVALGGVMPNGNPPADDGRSPTGGAPPPPGGGELSDDQKRAYSAFIAAHDGKPSAPVLKTFLEKLTGKTVTNSDAIATALAKGQGASTTTRTLNMKASCGIASPKRTNLALEKARSTLR